LFLNHSTLERSLERAKRKSQSRLKKLESEIEIMVSTHTLQVIFTFMFNKSMYLIVTVQFYWCLGEHFKRKNRCTGNNHYEL